MTNRERELREELESGAPATAVATAVALCREFLFISGEHDEAERLLLDALGKQSKEDGYIVQLLLAELYLKMDETPRAQRLLKFPLESSNEEIKSMAMQLQSALVGS
jgi:thioredoxin-like negative regulator of GroEL